MGEKFAFTIRKTHWSLALKAFLFGLCWYALPFWLFLLVAAALYFSPLFHPLRLLIPFLLTLILMGFSAPALEGAAVFGTAFFLILGIKDLVLINREAAYEILVFLLAASSAFLFFSSVSHPRHPSALTGALGVGIMLFLLLRNLVTYFAFPKTGERHATPPLLLAGIVAFLAAQAAGVLLFLPMGAWYETALLLLIVAVLTEFFFRYARARLTRNAILFSFSFLFPLVVFALASNQWAP